MIHVTWETCCKVAGLGIERMKHGRTRGRLLFYLFVCLLHSCFTTTASPHTHFANWDGTCMCLVFIRYASEIQSVLDWTGRGKNQHSLIVPDLKLVRVYMYVWIFAMYV